MFSDAKIQFCIANEVILRLDVAQESRALSPAEFRLRKFLKMRIVGLAAIERAWKRQASRVLWLRAGDASTKYFHVKFCSRRRKNFIHSLQQGDHIATSHMDKAKIIEEHFSKSLDSGEPRSITVNWELLRLPRVQAAGLDNPFSEEEIWAAILESPAEKSPGPDGFCGTFFRACWPIIKADALLAFQQFYNLAGGDLGQLNTAMVALLPKKDGAAKIEDFRPISLIHSFAKLVTKVLAIRLSRVIHTIISPAQTAFLKSSVPQIQVHSGQLLVRAKRSACAAQEESAGDASEA